MIKIKSRSILSIITTLIVSNNSSAKTIDIQFNNQGSFYTSPVVYLTAIDGQKPKVAVINGVQTLGGTNEIESDLSNFNSVSFQMNEKIDSKELKIISISSEKNTFCNQLNLSLQSSPEGNKILLPSVFPKLITSTSCHFKIVSLNKKNDEVTENKITFMFNYTLPGWLSDLGKGTEAQRTANIIEDMCINPYSKEIRLNKALVDISPFMSFIYTEILDFSVNKIKVIPDSIGDLAKLRELYFHNNKIKKIPDTIGSLAHLQVLDLSANHIPIIPDAIGNLTNLQRLYLQNNEIQIIPDFIGKLIYLKDLFLGVNNIKVIPEVIGNLINLKSFYFHGNKVTKIPSFIGSLINLQNLDLSDNQIKEIPDALSALKELQELDLSDNQIEIIPDFIGGLEQLHVLNFHNNKISTIPDSLKNLFYLQDLDLSENQIEVIPDSIKNLINLMQPLFDHNEIRYINENLYDWLLDKMADLFNNPGINDEFGNRARIMVN